MRVEGRLLFDDTGQEIASFAEDWMAEDWLRSYTRAADQGHDLRQIVNLIRGDAPPDTSWSTHDAVELVHGLVGELAMYKHSVACLQKKIQRQIAADLRASPTQD